MTVATADSADSRLSTAASIATVTAAGSGGTIRSGRTCGKETYGNLVGMPPNSGTNDWIELSALTNDCSKFYPAQGILFS